MAKTRYLREMLANTRCPDCGGTVSAPVHACVVTRSRRPVNTKVVVKIENDYSDKHHSEREVELDAPGADIDEWWQEVVYPETGDGHGIDFDGGSCYTATIVAGPARLLGETFEWVD